MRKSKTETLERQQELDKRKIEHFEEQRTTVINSTKTLAGVVEAVRNKQGEFVFTEFNPVQTQYFILNNSSVSLAGKILPIDAIENGSVIHISLVDLLSVPVSNMSFYATWEGEKPTGINALAK